MLTRDIIDFANENPACWLATADGDQPHVRGLLLWFADERGFFFHTAANKRLPAQLRKNSRVEIAFYQPPRQPMGNDGRMMRVAGRVRFLDPEEHRERLVRERPWLAPIMHDNPEAKLVVFCVESGEVQHWSMAVNTREAEQPRVSFRSTSAALFPASPPLRRGQGARSRGEVPGRRRRG